MTQQASSNGSSAQEPTKPGSEKKESAPAVQEAASPAKAPDEPPLTLKEKFRRGVWIAEMWSVWPMFILSVIFAVISTVYLVARQDMNGFEITVVVLALAGIWQVFIVDYVVRLLAAKKKWTFIKTNALELLTVVFPFFRPLLILIYIWKLPVTDDTSDRFLRTRFQLTVAAFALFFLYFVSTLVWLVEMNAPHANIVNWGDSMWWGVTTLTTVGYGDFVPVTTLGRLLGSLLMVGGIFIVGVISASVVSSFADQLKDFTRRRAMAAQEQWKEVKEMTPSSHYPRWAHRDRFRHRHRGSADTATSSSAPGAPDSTDTKGSAPKKA